MAQRKIYTIIAIIAIVSVLTYFIVRKYTKSNTKTSTVKKPNTITFSDIVESTGTGGEVPPVELLPPSDFNIALSNAYGNTITTLPTMDYFYMLPQMSGGTAKYYFYGKSNGNAYPTAEYARSVNGYATLDIPSHSVTLNQAYYDVVSKVEYTIKDSEGNIVMYCYDTKGGMGGFGSNDKRSNNHTRHSQRYLPHGIYTIEFKNISDNDNVVQKFNFGRTSINHTEFFSENVVKGQTVTKTLNLFDSPESAFKLNCNFV